LKAEILEHPLHATDTDRPTVLTELLRNHLGGSLGIQKAVADNLTDDFGRTPVVGLGTAFVGEQGQGTAFPVSRPELEVALFAETEFLGGVVGAESFTFAFNKHGEFAGDFIIGGDGEKTGSADELLAVQVELGHGYSRVRRGTDRRGRKNGERHQPGYAVERKSQIKYGSNKR
jgi:hypothetical protein